MPAPCPNCQSTAQPGDRFCPQCGTALTAPTSDDFTPVLGMSGPPDMRVRRKPGKRRPWYRRKPVMIPLVLLVLLGVTVGGTIAYLSMQFDSVNALSTPPPEISSARLGGEEGIAIDTRPAQAAVRAEAERDEAPDGAGEPTATSEAVTSGNAGAEGAQADDPADEGATTTEENPRTAVVASTDGGSSTEPPAPSGQEIAVSDVTPDAETAAPSDQDIAANDVTPVALAAQSQRSEESIAILMMGVDARPGEPIDVGVRPDSLAVAYLDASDGSCWMLSIPRDTRVELPGYGQSKINHALAVGGIPYQALVVEGLLGIELDHYGLVDFAGVEGLVNAVGGITVSNDEAFSIDGHAFPVGTLELTGEEALAFSRYRYGPDGDFGRQERQQQVVRALLTQGAGLDIVRSVPRLLGAVEGHIRTSLDPRDMVDVAQDYRRTCTAETLVTGRIEGTVANAYDELMQQELSFVLVDPAEVHQKVAWLLTGDGAVSAGG